MEQSVYMASFAFFIPLKRIRGKYKRPCASKMRVETPFAHFPNAQCYYKALENTKQSDVVSTHTFYYKSRYNSRDEVWRQVMVKPFLLEFKLGKGGLFRALALQIFVDKTFEKENSTEIHSKDFVPNLIWSISKRHSSKHFRMVCSLQKMVTQKVIMVGLKICYMR